MKSDSFLLAKEGYTYFMSKSNPMSPNAKRVFKGELFEVWQWEQKLYDGSTAVFEKIRRQATALVIPVVGDKILIQRQEQPHRRSAYLSLAGGRIEDGEEPLLAAQRELLEQTGYK